MKLDKKIPVIAVIGASFASEDVLDIAHKVGGEISNKGWHLVCGGGSGVMEAACKGFRFARNELNIVRNMAIGILPGDEASLANDYIDLAIPTGIGFARNAIITKMASAVIAVGGCSGTLSELAFAWQMDKPIVAMANSGGWADRLAGQAIDARRSDTIIEAQNSLEAIDKIESLISAKLSENLDNEN